MSPQATGLNEQELSWEENCIKGHTAKLDENFCHFARFVLVKAGLLKCS
jgi:hypothetical protein